jgi:hypothetical protein
MELKNFYKDNTSYEKFIKFKKKSRKYSYKKIF